MPFTVYDLGVINGVFIMLSIALFFIVLIALSYIIIIEKKLRKYRYRYGYDNEIENPSRINDIQQNERFGDWISRIGFKKHE